MYSNIECEIVNKMYKKYHLLDFNQTNINDLTRKEIEQMAFRFSLLLISQSIHSSHLLGVYKRKNDFLDSKSGLSKFLTYENNSGNKTIANNFNEIQDKINAMSDHDLEEQIRKIIKFELELEEFQKFSQSIREYISTFNHSKSSLQSITFANEHAEEFNSNELDELNEIKNKINTFIAKTGLEHIVPTDFANNPNLYDIQTLKSYLNDYNCVATNIWKRYLNDPRASNKDCRYLIHDGVIDGDKYYQNIISTSLITEKHTNTYRYGYGIIIMPNTIIGADSRDVGAENYSTSSSQTAPIKLPQQVEAECIESGNYSEINSQNYEIVGTFAIVNNQRGFNIPKLYKKSKKLAKRLNIPFVQIDDQTKTQQIIHPEQNLSTLDKIQHAYKVYIAKAVKLKETFQKLVGIDNKSNSLSLPQSSHEEDFKECQITIVDEVADIASSKFIDSLKQNIMPEPNNTPSSNQSEHETSLNKDAPDSSKLKVCKY